MLQKARRAWHALVGPPVETKSVDELADGVCDAFNALSPEQKGALMSQYGDLYLKLCFLVRTVEARRGTW